MLKDIQNISIHGISAWIEVKVGQLVRTHNSPLFSKGNRRLKMETAHDTSLLDNYRTTTVSVSRGEWFAATARLDRTHQEFPAVPDLAAALHRSGHEGLEVDPFFEALVNLMREELGFTIGHALYRSLDVGFSKKMHRLSISLHGKCADPYPAQIDLVHNRVV